MSRARPILDETPSPPRGGREPRAATPDWAPLRPQTLVDLATDAIVGQAARGAILPGDRIVEAEVAKRLGISRVPVREALRLLESGGIVVNERYKGIRLRPVTNQRVRDLVEARCALETTAALRAVAAGRHRGSDLAPLEAALQEMEASAARGDDYGLAAADTAFHRELCRLGGNAVVLDLWEALARQSTIIFGLAARRKPMTAIAAEHRPLLTALRRGRSEAIAAALEEHVTRINLAVDYEAILRQRRAAREAEAADPATLRRTA